MRMQNISFKYDNNFFSLNGYQSKTNGLNELWNWSFNLVFSTTSVVKFAQCILASNDERPKWCTSNMYISNLKRILWLCHWLWPIFILVTFLNFKWPSFSASPEYELGTSRFSWRIMSFKLYYIKVNMVNQNDLKPLCESSETRVTYVIIE